ncbi:MAG: hypothetical protein JO147_11460 [Actinobacteria bacterium]|nr:hypothetical protein [Actinomycetota bacterium]
MSAGGVAAGLVVAGTVGAWRTPRSRVPFYGLVAVVPIELVMIIVAGHRLR